MIVERIIDNDMFSIAPYPISIGIKEYRTGIKDSLNGSFLMWFGIAPIPSKDNFITADGYFEHIRLGRMWTWL